MSSATYRELLLDPRWQKRRLEVLACADFRCSRCHHGDKNLQVHHRRYVRGRMPWEYSDVELVVLCDDCHELQHLPAPTEDDAQREKTIEKLRDGLLSAIDQDERRQIIAAMNSLVADRSHEQVRRMERDRGLA